MNFRIYNNHLNHLKIYNMHYMTLYIRIYHVYTIIIYIYTCVYISRKPQSRYCRLFSLLKMRVICYIQKVNSGVHHTPHGG